MQVAQDRFQWQAPDKMSVRSRILGKCEIIDKISDYRLLNQDSDLKGPGRAQSSATSRRKTAITCTILVQLFIRLQPNTLISLACSALLSQDGHAPCQICMGPA
jgi:hypothetical protein